MNRIIDVEKIVLKPDVILAEVVEIQRSNIILPGAEDSPESLDYLKVVTVGTGVTDIKKGDYILEMTPGTNVSVYLIQGVKYGLVYRGNVHIAVDPSNFNKDASKKGADLSV